MPFASPMTLAHQTAARRRDRGRPKILGPASEAELLARWYRGESVRAAAEQLGVSHMTAYRALAPLMEE